MGSMSSTRSTISLRSDPGESGSFRLASATFAVVIKKAGRNGIVSYGQTAQRAEIKVETRKIRACQICARQAGWIGPQAGNTRRREQARQEAGKKIRGTKAGGQGRQVAALGLRLRRR